MDRTVKGTTTILLVDDEPSIRAMLRVWMVHEGYEVFEAADGIDALRVAARIQGPLHLLVTDCEMPNMRGPELADNLLGQDSGLKVLFISGLCDESAVRERLEPGRVVFLAKPFQVATMLDVVHGLLSD